MRRGYHCLIIKIFCVIFVSLSGINASTAGTINVEGVNAFQAEVGSEDLQYYRVWGSGFLPNQAVTIEVVNASGPFSISSDFFTYSSTIEIQANVDGVLESTLALKYAPTTVGPHSTIITHSAALTTTKEMSVSGNTGTLPVQILSFKARSLEETLILNWSTASEVNSDRYEIELMRSSSDFKTIGVIPSAASNSTAITRYKFEYSIIGSAGIYYVRLKQIDQDGSFSYSEILSVAPPKTAGLNITLTHSPVAADPQLHISAAEAGEMNIVIMDMTGVKVYKGSYRIQRGENKFELEIHSIPSGLYVLTAAFKGKYDSLKLWM